MLFLSYVPYWWNGGIISCNFYLHPQIVKWRFQPCKTTSVIDVIHKYFCKSHTVLAYWEHYCTLFYHGIVYCLRVCGTPIYDFYDGIVSENSFGVIAHFNLVYSSWQQGGIDHWYWQTITVSQCSIQLLHWCFVVAECIFLASRSYLLVSFDSSHCGCVDNL